MIDKVSALEIARGSGWLSRQSRALQDDLLSRCMLRSYAKDEVICHYGDPHNGVYALVAGVLRIEFPTIDGDYRIASVKQPVFWFGHGASLAQGNFYATTTAASEVSVFFLPHREFESLLRNADYCRAFSLIVLEHFSEASQVISQLLVTDTENRVAARIALLSETAGRNTGIVVPVTQSELAEMCGLSRHTVQQILNSLERRGLISARYGRIEVPSVENLLRACSETGMSAAKLSNNP
jgi:CRP/FNR family transcriptional regulator, cyclic AMP receptor protein